MLAVSKPKVDISNSKLFLFYFLFIFSNKYLFASLYKGKVLLGNSFTVSFFPPPPLL